MKGEGSPPPWPLLKRSAATGLLVFVAAVFLLTIPREATSFWVSLIHASVEAALVGGLADWFAVTALFRRPLGLPIPHTAVVTANKGRIGHGLANFLADNFLTFRHVADAFRWIDFAARLGVWLRKPENADMAARWLSSAGADMIARGPPDLRAFGKALPYSDIRPLLGLAIKELSGKGFDSALLDDVLSAAKAFLRHKETDLQQRAGRRRRGILRQSFDRQVMRATMQGLEALIDDLSIADSPSRQKILSFVRGRVSAGLDSAQGSTVANEFLRRVVQSPEFDAWLLSILSPDGRLKNGDFFRNSLRDGLAALGARLMSEPRSRARLNAIIERAMLDALPLREAVVALVESVVSSYEAEEFAERIETVVEKDLQFIRINGTIVGAAIGAALFMIEAVAS